MPEETDDETTERIIELLNEGGMSQDEIADEVGVSQSTVSRINRGLGAGKKKGKREGKKEGYAEGFSDARNFQKDDGTEKPEEDDYWCSVCESEGNGKVEVEYLAEECPNGHDLSDAW